MGQKNWQEPSVGSPACVCVQDAWVSEAPGILSTAGVPRKNWEAGEAIVSPHRDSCIEQPPLNNLHPGLEKWLGEGQQ